MKSTTPMVPRRPPRDDKQEPAAPHRHVQYTAIVQGHHERALHSMAADDRRFPKSAPRSTDHGGHASFSGRATIPRRAGRFFPARPRSSLSSPARGPSHPEPRPRIRPTGGRGRAGRLGTARGVGPAASSGLHGGGRRATPPALRGARSVSPRRSPASPRRAPGTERCPANRLVLPAAQVWCIPRIVPPSWGSSRAAGH